MKCLVDGLDSHQNNLFLNQIPQLRNQKLNVQCLHFCQGWMPGECLLVCLNQQMEICELRPDCPI